ncbi:Hypothetical predicted protein, partial [Pelobates cultripes]
LPRIHARHNLTTCRKAPPCSKQPHGNANLHFCIDWASDEQMKRPGLPAASSGDDADKEDPAEPTQPGGHLQKDARPFLCLKHILQFLTLLLGRLIFPHIIGVSNDIITQAMICYQPYK